MPKDRRSKISQRHQPSAKTASRIFAVPDVETEKLDQPEGVLNVPANDILRAATIQSAPEFKASTHTPTKKEKQQLKHERLLQRLASDTTPYSKSHNRRLKRKERAALSTDMQSVEKALTILAGDILPSETQAKSQTDTSARPARPAPGLIGAGKGVTLSKRQRKKALELERLRQSAVMQNTEYQKNPFDAIRRHAQNSLLSHENSEKS